MVLTTHSHNRQKWTRLLKIWFPMPTLQKETQKRSVIFTRKNLDHVYILTCKCYRVRHTHLRKTLRVYNFQDFFFMMVKNQMKDDVCV
jgi:hypothetical protein